MNPKAETYRIVHVACVPQHQNMARIAQPVNNKLRVTVPLATRIRSHGRLDTGDVLEAEGGFCEQRSWGREREVARNQANLAGYE